MKNLPTLFRLAVCLLLGSSLSGCCLQLLGFYPGDSFIEVLPSSTDERKVVDAVRSVPGVRITRSGYGNTFVTEREPALSAMISVESGKVGQSRLFIQAESKKLFEPAARHDEREFIRRLYQAIYDQVPNLPPLSELKIHSENLSGWM